jgi:uncharacterized protein YdhG (YjbR/CyaY superfamily)
MANAIETVEQYMEQVVPENRKHDLIQLRNLIIQIVPNAIESIKYGMPYYELNGSLCAFASQKNYMSLYFLNTPILQKNIDSLRDLNVGKGCIRFRNIDQLSITVIQKILEESVEDNLARYNDHC